MNTTEIIYEIARRSKQTSRPLTREEVVVAIDLLLDILREELTQPDGEIRLKQIGILQVKRVKRSGGLLRIGQHTFRTQNTSADKYYRLSFTVSRTLRRLLTSIS